MEKRGNKTYYFTGTLSPAESCRDFNPGELHIGNGYVLDIFFNGITIWNPNLNYYIQPASATLAVNTSEGVL